jgi:hypothetical protein
MMDGLIVSGGVARGPQDGPNVHYGLSLMSQSLILYSSGVRERNNFCVACIWFSRQSVVTDKSIVVF